MEETQQHTILRQRIDAREQHIDELFDQIIEAFYENILRALKENNTQAAEDLVDTLNSFVDTNNTTKI